MMEIIWVDADRCMACKTCEIVCALKRSSLSRRLPEALYEVVSPLPRVRVEPIGTEKGFPLQCRHCEDAPCLDACPAGALFRDPEGLVLVQDERCIGCWMCIMVCPFGALQPFREFRKVVKCDRCKGMDAPACVEMCPTHALILADSEKWVAEGLKPLKKGSLIRLDFLSDKSCLKSS